MAAPDQSPTLDIVAALEAAPSRGARRCNVGEFLDSIPTDTAGRDELIRLVETPHKQGSTNTRSGQNIAMVLCQLGFETTQNPILDHRKRACRCYR